MKTDSGVLNERAITCPQNGRIAKAEAGIELLASRADDIRSGLKDLKMEVRDQGKLLDEVHGMVSNLNGRFSNGSGYYRISSGNNQHGERENGSTKRTTLYLTIALVVSLLIIAGLIGIDIPSWLK